MSALVSNIARRASHAIVWFRNDLRLQDNIVLKELISNKSHTNTATFLYCFDPRQFGYFRQYGGRKTEIFRANFVLESVVDLRNSLRQLGLELIVAWDQPENVLPLLLQPTASNVVYYQLEPATEERIVEEQVKASCLLLGHDCNFSGIEDNAELYAPSTSPFRRDYSDVPNLFTNFKNRLEQLRKIGDVFPAPKIGELPQFILPSALTSPSSLRDNSTWGIDYLPSLHTLGFTDDEIETWHRHQSIAERNECMIFRGGESKALERVQSWAFDGDHLQRYFEIRNGMLGESYSSKLSPWLALGCISPRTIAAAVKRYESIRGIQNKSTYWLIWELTCRDYFRYIYLKYRQQVFYAYGPCGSRINSKDWLKPSSNPNVADAVDRWKKGRTGLPLVDANMRELLHTGFMSNRGRQNVASYLVYDLNIDWRVGAHHFESLLLDSDVYVNYGNWNAAAGLLGGRINRFNIVKQSKDYDPAGKYIKTWVPELSNVPVPLLFEPWKLSLSQQHSFGVVIGKDYPRPINLSTSNILVTDFAISSIAVASTTSSETSGASEKVIAAGSGDAGVIVSHPSISQLIATEVDGKATSSKIQKPSARTKAGRKPSNLFFYVDPNAGASAGGRSEIRAPNPISASHSAIGSVPMESDRKSKLIPK